MASTSEIFVDADHQRVNQAVREAESATSAEILPVVARSSGRYDRPEDIVGLWFAGLAMIIVWMVFPLPIIEAGPSPQTSSLKQAILVLSLVFVIFAAIAFTVLPTLKQQLAARPPAPLILDRPPILQGDPEAGESLFFSEDLMCAQCHTMGRHGGEIGPDLTEVSLRRNDENLRRAILRPSGNRIPIPHVVATIVDVNGRVYNGITRSLNHDPIQVVLANGDVIRIAQEDVEESTEQPISPMPDNYADLLTVRQLSDLVAFLQQGPKQDKTLPSDQSASQAMSPGADAAE